MHKEGEEIHETPTEARAGVNVRGMTTVLFVSIALILVLFLGIWLFVMR
jgi:uncharacterized membrane protein